MHTRRRTLTLGVLAATMSLAACQASTDAADPVAAGSSSAAAAASSAAVASPGVYGTPAVPSMPNPTAVATDTPVAPPTASGGTVGVVVTYSGWQDSSGAVEVGAYAAGVTESGGTCTLTLTKGADSVTAQGPAESDASSTACPPLSVPGSELSSGTWTAVVRYTSPTSSGQSDPGSVVVP